MVDREQLCILINRKAFQQEMSKFIRIELLKEDEFIDLIQNALEEENRRNVEIVLKKIIKFYTLERLAEEYNITKERVRQIILEVEKTIADEYSNISYKNNSDKEKQQVSKKSLRSLTG